MVLVEKTVLDLVVDLLLTLVVHQQLMVVILLVEMEVQTLVVAVVEVHMEIMMVEMVVLALLLSDMLILNSYQLLTLHYNQLIRLLLMVHQQRLILLS